nr:hypothetical protein [Ruminococcus sp. FC2018]
MSDRSGGTAASDKATAKAGETVALTVAPDNGYTLDSIRVITAKNKDAVELAKVSDTKYTFTMPTESVIASAEFEETEEAQSCVSGASLSLNGEIGVNLYIKLGNLIGDGAYVMVKGPNDTEAKRVDLNSELYDINQNAYKVSCPVYAPQMGEKVEFTLFDENGVQHDIWNSAKTSSYEVYRYAVNDYIETAKIKGGYNLKQLAGKMQNYGAWARDYLIASKQTSSDTAAICDTTEVTGVNASTFESKQIEKSSGFAVEGLSVSLSLDSKTALRIYYKGDSKEDKDVTAKHGTENVTLIRGTARDKNYVEIDNIPAHHLRDNYEFTFGDKGNATVSAYSYCYLVLANSTNEKLKSTVKAMYEYSEAAKNYFPKN